jgi:hypothetical protein
MDNADMASDHLKMIHAVHGVFPNNLSADGMAAALLTLLVKRPEVLSQLSTAQLVKQLRALIRVVAKELGAAFDGCLLLRSILSFDVSLDSWRVRDEENRARLRNLLLLSLWRGRIINTKNRPHAKQTFHWRK